MITARAYDGVGDAAPRGDCVGRRVARWPSTPFGEGGGVVAFGERGDDLLGRVLHAVGRVRGVDARDVELHGGGRTPARGEEFFGSQQRALKRVSLGGDVGDVAEHLLLLREGVAVSLSRE